MQSRFEDVRRSILSELAEGRWQPGDRFPALGELAAQWQVSPGTAERALQGLIADGVLERRPKKGTFVRQILPQECRRAPVAVIGASRPWSGSWPLLDAFSAEIGARDWILLGDDALADLPQRLRDYGVPVLVAVHPQDETVAALERVAEAGMHVLCLGARVVSPRLHALATDNIRGMQDGLRYLAQLGHRRVAFLGTLAQTYDTRDRVEGFHRAVQEFGLDADEALFTCADDPRGIPALVDDAVAAWFALPEPPTAIFSGGCMLTDSLLTALDMRGIRYPETVSIVAFDDFPLARHLARPMTVVRQPLELLAQRAAQSLFTLHERAEPLRLVIPPELIVRDSARPL